MPRQRARTQPTDTNVTAPKVTAPKPTAIKEVEDEVIVTIAEPEIEDSLQTVVEPEPVVIEESQIKASKAITTNIGVVDTKEEPKPFIPHYSAPNGLILKANEPVRIEADDHGNYVVVKRDVYREVYPMKAKRPSYFLLYTKGSQVLKSTLQALN